MISPDTMVSAFFVWEVLRTHRQISMRLIQINNAAPHTHSPIDLPDFDLAVGNIREDSASLRPAPRPHQKWRRIALTKAEYDARVAAFTN